MKQFFFSLLILFVSQSSYSQSLSKTMIIYQNACLKMLDGIKNNCDRYILWDAIDMYKKVNITEFSDKDFMPVDSCTIINEISPRIYFIPEYADSLIKFGKIVPIDNISILRKGEDFDIQIVHKGIKANKSVAYKSLGQDNCEMMVVGESGSNVKLTIRDVESGVVYEGIQENGGLLSYVIWRLPTEGSEFIFKIDNLSDKDISIVVAVN